MPQPSLIAIGAARTLPHDAVLDLDPRHPLAHAPLQLEIDWDRDAIASAELRLGLLHRSVEKLLEARDYRQALSLADRHDWVSPFISELVLAQVIEDALGLTPPSAALAIRSLMADVTRISATLLFVGAGLGDEDSLILRERLVMLQEKWCGNRVHPMAVRIGGIAYRPSAAWLDALEREMIRIVAHLATSSTIATAIERLRGIAVLDHADALSCGATGPVEQASRGAGDAAARYEELLAHVPVSIASIREQATALREDKDGAIEAALPKVVKVPEGTYYGEIASTTGTAGVLLVSTGDKAPWRVHLRTPSNGNAQAMCRALSGVTRDRLADAAMSFFLITGDIER